MNKNINSKRIILFISTLSISLLNLSFISSSNFRELQDNNTLMQCTQKKPSNTGKECFDLSNSSVECCLMNTGNTNICTPIPKTGQTADLYRASGISDISKYNLYINYGNIDLAMQCSNASPFSGDVINNINNCANLVRATSAGCAKFTTGGSRCCYVNTGKSSVSIASKCMGIVSTQDIPQFSYSYNIPSLGLYTINCGVSEDEQAQMEACAMVKPQMKDDCTKNSKGSVSCLYANYFGYALCIGVKGDINAVKNLNLASNLQGIEINSASLLKSSFSYALILLIGFIFI